MLSSELFANSVGAEVWSEVPGLIESLWLLSIHPDARTTSTRNRIFDLTQQDDISEVLTLFKSKEQIMNAKEEIARRKDQLPTYGLGIFMLIVGLSKFLILDFWVGYEPQFLVELLPITARQITTFGGVFEAALGALLLSGKRAFYAASITSLWLLIITVQMARLGLWDLAIRDLGLTFYALTVAVTNYRKN